jgi:hypothetical protein
MISASIPILPSGRSAPSSSASTIGETATNAGLAFVTGGAGIAISVGGTSDLRLALRDKSAADLEKLGHEEWAAIGVL